MNNVLNGILFGHISKVSGVRQTVLLNVGILSIAMVLTLTYKTGQIMHWKDIIVR